MDNASKNAKDMIASLQMKYNRGRQAAITSELIDIITGMFLSCPLHGAIKLFALKVRVLCEQSVDTASASVVFRACRGRIFKPFFPTCNWTLPCFFVLALAH
jgi:hypothetical protein